MAILQNYTALAAAWLSVSGAGILAKLSALNATITVAQTVDADGNVLTPNIYWPQTNGWQGPINQNDLVVAGILTDPQRIAWEANPT